MLTLSIFLLAIHTLEVGLYLAMAPRYYDGGPRWFEIEWQTNVSVGETLATLQRPTVWRRHIVENEATTIRVRRRLTWIDLTRHVLQIEDSSHGAVIRYTARPMLTLALPPIATTLLVIIGAPCLFWLVTAAATMLSLYGLLRREHSAMLRDPVLRAALKRLGAAHCLHCGCNLHGVLESHVCPECGRPEPAIQATDGLTIEQMIAERVAMRLFGAVVSAGFGCLLTLACPVFVATAAWIFCGRFYRWYPWSMCFALSAVVCIPALVLAARRHRDRAVDLPDVSDMPYSARRVLFPLTTSAGLTAIFLAGPRLLFDAAESYRRGRRLPDHLMTRAAAVMEALLARDLGIAPSCLRQSGEPAESLDRVLDWLEHQGWVGRTANRDFVYLSGDARRRFEHPFADGRPLR